MQKACKKWVSVGVQGCLVLGLASAAFGAPETQWNGSVQIQGQKAIWEDPSDNNLDDLWGRINLGLKTVDKERKYQAVLNIRAFPEGFGYEALTSVKLKGEGEDLTVDSKSTNIGRFQVEQAWVRYGDFMGFSLKMGRWSTNSVTNTLGNFVDADPGAAFQGKIVYHNATAIGYQTEWAEGQLLFGVTDNRLNQGYFAGHGKLKETVIGDLTAAYRSNVFDLYKDGDANIEHRMSTLWQGPQKWVVAPHVELGMLRKNADSSDYAYPVLVGASWSPIKGQKILLEGEYLDGREVTGGDQPLSMHLGLDSKLGEYSKIQFGLFTDAKAPEWSDLRWALRVSHNLF
jgi:hypothetical protein